MHSMRTVHCIALVGALFLFALAPLTPAAEPLADLHSLDALELEGAKYFSTDALRKGLRWDLELLLAAHPRAPVKDYLALLEKRLIRGYRHAGFPDVRGAARVSGQSDKIVAQIVEGPRYTCGEVRVTGTRKVPVAFLTAWLKQARLSGSTNIFVLNWTNSAPVPFTEMPHIALAEAVTNAFLDLGYAQPKFDLQLTPDPKRGVADFIVRIQHEGPKSVIAEIDVLGARTNSPQSIVDFLGLK